jgi:uncharacterized protein YjbJ (UPF0337 family)
MTATVDAIGGRVSPRQVARRRTQRMRGWVVSVRDSVMGTAGQVAGQAHDVVGHAGDQVSGTWEGLGERAAGGGDLLVRRAQGNPVGAGVIAFGLGLLLGSLAPPTEPEQRTAAVLLERAQPLVEEAKASGSELASGLQGAAQDAAGRVADVASGAVQQVKEQASSTVADMKDGPAGSS